MINTCIFVFLCPVARRALLPRTDPSYAAVEAAFCESTLLAGKGRTFKVSRIFALKNPLLSSQVWNAESKLRLESASPFHNMEVQDWSMENVSCASPSKRSVGLRYNAMKRLRDLAAPAWYRSRKHVTGVVQVFHGCFSESGAHTIVRS